MPVCSFCGREFPKHTGICYVTNAGRVYWFCSRKCFRSLIDFGRRPEKFKWTKAYRLKREREKKSAGESSPGKTS